jgi:hypothetical protein
MTCRQFHQQVDRLVFGDLPPVEQDALRAHAAFCDKCAELWETELQLRDGLAAQSIPEPTADFESRIRTKVLSGGRPGSSPARATNLKRAPVWGSAIAAVLALGVFIGMQISPSEIRDQRPTVATAPTPEAVETATGPELKTVRLAFNSRTAMDNVTLTLEMPPNAELAPFPGRQSISWKVNLKQGDNVLALPVNVLFAGTGKLIAHLDKGTLRKTFSTAISNTTEPSP